mmetsp:Transcript_27130/g.41635  ORF Transcript_27130/g.41635 Transcript_27130/m.41635 type:complete len:231 (+) Transcript_27130:1046-1738(+)
MRIQSLDFLLHCIMSKQTCRSFIPVVFLRQAVLCHHTNIRHKHEILVIIQVLQKFHLVVQTKFRTNLTRYINLLQLSLVQCNATTNFLVFFVHVLLFTSGMRHQQLIRIDTTRKHEMNYSFVWFFRCVCCRTYRTSRRDSVWDAVSMELRSRDGQLLCEAHGFVRILASHCLDGVLDDSCVCFCHSSGCQHSKQFFQGIINIHGWNVFKLPARCSILAICGIAAKAWGLR